MPSASPGAEMPSSPVTVGARLVPLLWVASFAVTATLVQLLPAVPADTDTSYHFAVAELWRSHGVLHAFPWTPFSVLAERYADKELLLHALFVPLVPLGMVTAARVVGALLGALMLSALYLVLRREGVRLAGVWTYAALLASGYFVLRFALVRPHLISVTLALLIAWACARRNAWLAAALCLAFPLCHVGFGLALALALGVEASQLLGGRRPDWRLPLACAAGLALGTAVHPNASELPAFVWVQIRDVLSKAWQEVPGFDLGPEFAPFSAREFLAFGLWPAAMSAAAVALALRKRREAPVALAFAVLVCGLALLTLRSQRFIEYLVPFAVAALGTAVQASVPPKAVDRLGLAALAAGLAWTGTVGSTPIADLGRVVSPFPEPIAQDLRRLVGPDDQVFTCGWGRTGELLVAMPERKFLVALDPTFFWKKDPERYRLWYGLVREPGPSSPVPLVRDAFAAQWIFCEHEAQYGKFLAAVDQDPRAKLALRTRFFSLWDVRSAQ